MMKWLLLLVSLLGMSKSMAFQRTFSPNHNNNNNNSNNNNNKRSFALFMKPKEPDRRDFFVQSFSWAALVASSVPQGAIARGMVQFPCDEGLGNTYHFMRAGENILESEDIWSTNPLFLTNRADCALSPKGIEQVEETINVLREKNIGPTILKHSLAASSIDAANMLGKEFKIGRDRIVAEYVFMDPRAVGKFDMMPLTATEAAVWALDATEAGPRGLGGRPPANDDSTPHETLADQTTRLAQLLSGLETQYSGDTIIVVFPDGTGPALLSCMIAGIPFDRVHELEYAPGEARLNITMPNTLALLESRQGNLKGYHEKIEAGKIELERLRSLRPEEMISAKDEKIERERLMVEEQYQEQQAELRRQEAEKQEAKNRIAAEIAKDKEKRRAKELQEQQERRRKLQEQKELAELQKQKRREEQLRQRGIEVREGAAVAQGNGGVFDGVVYGGASAIIAATAFLATTQPDEEGSMMMQTTVTSAASTNATGDDLVIVADEEVAARDLEAVDREQSEESNGKEQEEEEKEEEQVLDSSIHQPEGEDTQDVESALPLEEYKAIEEVTNESKDSEETAFSNSGLENLFQVDEAPTPPSVQIDQEEETQTLALDPEEYARKAMQDFLNRDDGREEWLNSLKQLMDKDESNSDEHEVIGKVATGLRQETASNDTRLDDLQTDDTASVQLGHRKPSPVTTAEERARQAMQDYLNQDDGRAAWLESLKSSMEANKKNP